MDALYVTSDANTFKSEFLEVLLSLVFASGYIQ